MAFYAKNEAPDFTREEFIHTAQRIKDEIPAEQSRDFNSDERTPVFYLSLIDSYITELMLPHSRVLMTLEQSEVPKPH